MMSYLWIWLPVFYDQLPVCMSPCADESVFFSSGLEGQAQWASPAYADEDEKPAAPVPVSDSKPPAHGSIPAAAADEDEGAPLLAKVLFFGVLVTGLVVYIRLRRAPKGTYGKGME